VKTIKLPKRANQASQVMRMVESEANEFSKLRNSEKLFEKETEQKYCIVIAYILHTERFGMHVDFFRVTLQGKDLADSGDQ
jgi:hypothetical protein